MPFNLFSGDPQQQAMLAVASGLLESGGPSRTPVGVGQGAARGMMQGREAFMAAQDAQMKKKLFDLKVAEAQRLQEAEAKKQAWLSSALSQGQPAPQMGVSDSSASALNAPWLAASRLPQSPAGPQPLSQDMLMRGLAVGAPVGDVLKIQESQNPNLKYHDVGGYISVRDKMNREVERLPKTAAPGSIPSHLSDLDAPGQRDFLLKRAEASRDNITNIVGGQNAFFKAIGDKLGEGFAKRQEDARAAAASLANMREGRALLDRGVITGAGAEAVVSGGQILQRMGVPLGEDANQTIANTQAFAATMGREVGNIIRLFGAGTGLSDADREYAKKIVGGEITLNEESIRRLFDINERLALAKIKVYNKEAEDILKTEQGKQFPRSALIVEMPEIPKAPQAEQPNTMSTMPPARQHKGKIIEDSKGVRYRSNGMTWQKIP